MFKFLKRDGHQPEGETSEPPARPDWYSEDGRITFALDDSTSLKAEKLVKWMGFGYNKSLSSQLETALGFYERLEEKRHMDGVINDLQNRVKELEEKNNE